MSNSSDMRHRLVPGERLSDYWSSEDEYFDNLFDMTPDPIRIDFSTYMADIEGMRGAPGMDKNRPTWTAQMPASTPDLIRRQPPDPTPAPSQIPTPIVVPIQPRIPIPDGCIHRTCIICLDAIADAVLNPCSHNNYCSVCVSEIRTLPLTCPICREPVEQVFVLKPHNFS